MGGDARQYEAPYRLNGRRGMGCNMTNPDPARVLEHLWVGTTRASGNLKLLQACGVTHVLNVGGTANWEGSRHGLELMQRDLPDEPSAELVDHLGECFAVSARPPRTPCLEQQKSLRVRVLAPDAFPRRQPAPMPGRIRGFYGQS